MGTFGGALEARQIDASNGKLTADVTGEVETEEGVSSAAFTWRCAWWRQKRRGKPSSARTAFTPCAVPLYWTLHKTIQLTSSFELAARVATS
jgi:hypothetical protein